MIIETPKPCPFCGVAPALFPVDPASEGRAFGEVRCVNAACPAKPRVRDGEDVADDRGSDAYKDVAIRRWNTRLGGGGAELGERNGAQKSGAVPPIELRSATEAAGQKL